MGLSLRRRLFIITAVALFPALAILVFNEVQLRRERGAEVDALALRQARLASLELERILDGVRGVMLTASSAAQIHNADVAGCDAFLAGIVQKVPTLTSLLVIDAGWRPVCASGVDALPVDKSSTSWLRPPITGSDIAIGNYQVSATGKRVLPVGLALADGDGQSAGLLIGTISLDWLGEQLKERGLTNGGQLTLADRNGTILTRDPLPERFVGTRIPSPYLHLVNADEPGTVEVLSQDGTERIIGYYPAKTQPTGIYLSAGISKAEAFAPINRSTSLDVALIVAGALAAFVLAWLVGRVAVQVPVDRILNTAAAWKNGDLSARTGFEPHGNELKAIGAALDEMMDDLRERTEHNALLSREMAHRIKNTLAVVQVIAAQTFPSRDTSKEKAIFAERLRGLAVSHDLLLADGWQGGDLRRSLEQALAPYRSGGGERIRMSGEAIELPPRAVLAVSMIAHELATNAIKYGALSGEAGGIDIGWSRLGPRVTIVWQENGGPPVTAPAKDGFGTKLIRRAFPAGFEPAIDVDYLPAGLRCSIAFRLTGRDDA